MSSVADIANEPDSLVFWVMPGLRYRLRMVLAFVLIAAGLLLQWQAGETGWAAGALVMLLGNLLLLVKGYDNRVEFGSWKPELQWQTVERERLAEIRRLDRDIRRWDRSLIDISNPLGLVAFFFICLGLLGGWIMLEGTPYRILAVDAAILLLPHWFTGTRRILRLPALLVKAETLEKALQAVRPEARGDRLQVMMLLKGREQPLPEDVKIRLQPEDAPDDFLGLYGQVVINNVQGKAYPYFYVVLVARPELGLEQLARELRLPDGLVSEFKEEKGVQILVLRQRTTRTSGYHTEPERVVELLTLGRHLVDRLLAARRGRGI